MAPRSRFGGPIRPGLLLAACLACLLPAPAPVEAQRLGRLPAGMSPDSVDFTTSELYVLERGTVSVFSLPGLVRLRTFGGSGRGRGRLSPNHTFDQSIRVTGQGVLAEDNEKLILFSPGGQVIAETRKPENTVWFVPVGDGYVAKSMVVSGTPPTQVMRLVLYDRALREVKELYRQPWFQQRQGRRFSTELLGDLLHFTVVQDRIAVEESPKGFVIETFDAAGTHLRTIAYPGRGVPVTAADKARELALVRTEKRVAAMIRMAGSWERLRQTWTITFPAVTPPLREIQANGRQLLARTFERNGDSDKYVLLDADGTSHREIWLPRPTDAETEARVSGTAFFKILGDRFYYLRHDVSSNQWDVHVATVPDGRMPRANRQSGPTAPAATRRIPSRGAPPAAGRRTQQRWTRTCAAWLESPASPRCRWARSTTDRRCSRAPSASHAHRRHESLLRGGGRVPARLASVVVMGQHRARAPGSAQSRGGAQAGRRVRWDTAPGRLRRRHRPDSHRKGRERGADRRAGLRPAVAPHRKGLAPQGTGC